jgi:para-aminobenzoate synthetase component I
VTLPLVLPLDPVPTVEDALVRFVDEPGVLLFDSARRGDPRGRYSFLMSDPIAWHVEPANGRGTGFLERVAADWGNLAQAENTSLDRDFPPFTGGAAGYLGYEFGRAFERVPTAPRDEFAMPLAAVGLYDRVIAWDHARDRAWLISHGWPKSTTPDRAQQARERADAALARLAGPTREPATRDTELDLPREQVFGAETGRAPGLRSDFTEAEYLTAVARAVEYIHAGDIFQVNLAQRLVAPWPGTSWELYRRLRRRNPAPFAGYFADDDWAILSASPERFLEVRDGEVSTRPIKGTRLRSTSPEADLFTRDELRESEKDRAENVMIVDLLRNDLSRVCEPGSVRVPQLCAVEAYETVQHLVSEVRGRLRPGLTAWDLLAATFPGGSITGAPKIRAMEIVAELEPTVRGPYCGTLFYCGADGTFDANILIRTFTHRRGWAQCGVGGGIVAQSQPAAEYRETWHKAEGMLRALFDG